MKQLLIAGLVALLAIGSACKGKDKDKPVETTTTTTAPTAPVEIAADDQLRKGVADATKDYPGVVADVKDGVITLSGEIAKDRYISLKQALDALQPKQVVNNLKYK